ncbi:MAG: hypothetical protein IJ794_00310 [Lachnospiraceae bacterium]|nr:hypothetical protein [Lachnospiraceae bacterium]
METLAATVSMLEALPENELQTIYEVTKSFYINRTSENPFQPKTEDDILAELDEAKAQADQGLYKSASAVSRDLRSKYGL